MWDSRWNFVVICSSTRDLSGVKYPQLPANIAKTLPGQGLSKPWKWYGLAARKLRWSSLQPVKFVSLDSTSLTAFQVDTFCFVVNLFSRHRQAMYIHNHVTHRLQLAERCSSVEWRHQQTQRKDRLQRQRAKIFQVHEICQILLGSWRSGGMKRSDFVLPRSLWYNLDLLT